ncbi:hypothetical protein EGR_10044 [Echinococcus granulosus]|uniref:Uncharacterized protein n=1 Tax=Echinococcus granulosus TaxID=6210 RepID=W6UNX9_ECHGR|nr:hypothetical protein EGR_10041 [Echinococcus granulosus]XP_024346303.1 hypothetical protein EGR_10044 [Echinococcus granulosus]EUB55104.1 hypothetical protein EGR_10041 [Echinococcus granulosus]EUB55107.1 hypothetical protein EGR_10044 [Echinococcus granulosus]
MPYSAIPSGPGMSNPPILHLVKNFKASNLQATGPLTFQLFPCDGYSTDASTTATDFDAAATANVLLKMTTKSGDNDNGDDYIDDSRGDDGERSK